MNQENNHIDQFFKDRLHDYEAPAPTDMWQKIDNQMKFKRRKMWWTIAGAMAASFALILSTGIGYYMGFNDHRKSIATIATKEIHYAKENAKPEFTKKSTTPVNTTTFNQTNKNQISNSGISKETININSYTNNTIDSNDSIYITRKSISNYNPVITKNDQQSDELPTLTKNNETTLNALSAIEYIALEENHKSQELMPVKTEIFLPVEENQENLVAVVDKKSSRFQIIVGGSFAPVYSYRDIRNNNTGFSSEYFNESEKALYTYSGGLNIQIEKGRFRLETGLYYSNMGQRIENLYVTDNLLASSGKSNEMDSYFTDGAPAPVRNSTGNIILKSSGNITLNRDFANNYEYSNMPIEKSNTVKSVAPQQTSAKQLFHYIELPVLAHYRLFSKYVQVSFSGGLSANFLVGNTLLMDQKGEEKNIGSTSDVKTINYAGITGFSFEVPVTNRLMFRMEPRMRYYLNSLVNSGQISTHPYTFGIYSGISYKF